MQVAFHCPWRNAEAWLAALRACGPEFAFVPWAELAEPAAIEAAVVWRPPAAMLQRLPNLRVICAMGAGVDYLFAAGLAPPNVPVVRLVDPVMSERMASYVLAAVLYHQRQLGRYREQQRERMWRQMMHSDTADVRIGMMGLGPMGRASAELLKRVGYDVAGWSRRPALDHRRALLRGPRRIRGVPRALRVPGVSAAAHADHPWDLESGDLRRSARRRRGDQRRARRPPD